MKKKSLCLLVAFFLFVLSVSSFASDLAHAKAIFEEKKYSEALLEFQDVFNTSSGDTRLDAFLHILRCHYSLKDHASLSSFYDAHKTEATGTSFEPDIHFEYANSLRDNAKDYAAARSMYESLYQKFPNTEFAGPGSLLKLGDLDVLEDKPNEGLIRYAELIKKYPDCRYIDNALEGKVNAYIKLKDRAALISALEDIRIKFPNNPCTARSGLASADYFSSIELNSHKALTEYRKVANEYPETAHGTIAKIRLADLVEDGRIKNSIALYRSVLEKPGKLRGSQEPWARTELGVALYLKKDFIAAREEFLKVISSNAPEKFKKKAEMHLEAIEDPESLSSAFVNIDTAVRYRRDLNGFDEAYWSFRVYTDAFEQGRFESFFKDQNVPDEEKAKRLYQISLSYYNEAHIKESILFAKRVVEEYPNVDYYCASAKYSIAHHKAMRGDYVGAIDDYLTIVEQYPTLEFIPIVLTKIGESFISLDRQAEAVYVYDTLFRLYPYRKEGMCGAQTRDFVLQGRPDLEKALEIANSTDGANLTMKKLPDALSIKIPLFFERLDKIKKKIELAMIQNTDRGESIEDRIFEIK